MSGIINKVKDALHSDKAHEQPEGTHGHHSSKAANAADPRIDSDRDGRANPATGSTTTHTGPSGLGSAGHSGPTHTSNVTGSHTATSGLSSTGPAPNTAGPHGSNALNKADPRVDSDADHRAAGVGSHAGGVGPSGTHTGVGSTGTHHAGGIGSTGTHTAGGLNSTGAAYNDPTGTHGPHSSKVANVADPRIDSDRDHRGAPGAAGTSHIGSGPGPAANTAGPHKQDLLNKADPRVDSDLDGSKTFGGNKTYQQ